MLIKIILLLLSISLLANGGQICKTGADCPEQQCCRDLNGQALIPTMWGGWWGIGDLDATGLCSTELGSEGDMCDGSCGCKKGLTCYRPMSGACCPPMKCYDAVWVQQQIDYWNNCRPPTCFFPPRDSIFG